MKNETRAKQILAGNFVPLLAEIPVTLQNKGGQNVELPSRLKILHWGDNVARDGKVYKVNEVTLASVPRNQAALGFDHVQIDFQHQTVPGSPFYKEPPVKVAASKAGVEVVEGEGVYLSAIAWTQDGKEFSASYPDVSATPFVDKAGNVLFIHSAALCPQGQVEGITLAASDVLASLQQSLAADAAETAEETAAQSTPTPPQAQQIERPDNMDYKKLILALVALPETATDEEIKTALAALTTKLSKLDGMDAAEVAALSANVVNLSTEVARIERDSIIASATAAGKVIPACALPDKDGKGGYPVEQLRTLAAELPVTVPVNGHNVDGTLATLSSSGALADPAGESVRKTLGIKPDRWAKR
ncbi:MAG: phage protease [Victivallaceae bacterium]|nr:phage protease [Victivallaceae bacterium]